MRGVCIVDPTSARLARYSRRTSRSTAQPSKAPATTQRPPARSRSSPGPNQGARDDVDDRVVPLGRGFRCVGDHPSSVSVHDHVGARTAHPFCLVATAHGHDARPTGFRQLHDGESDATGGPGDQDRVVAAGDRASLEHAQRGAIGDGQRGQLHVAKRRLVDTVNAVGRHDDVLGEAPVALATEHVDRTRVRPRVLVVGGIDQHARPHDVSRLLATGCNHGPGHVTALDAGEVERSQPAGPLVGVPVGALAGPKIGVVAARGAYADQHFVRPRARHRYVAHLDHVRPAMPGDDDRPHPGGKVTRVRHPWRRGRHRHARSMARRAFPRSRVGPLEDPLIGTTGSLGQVPEAM